MSTKQTTPAGGFSYKLTRTLDAPAVKVWQAWTTPEQYAQWAYAAAGSVEMDVRPGGAWKAMMVTPDGGQFPLSRRRVKTGSGSLSVLEPRRVTTTAIMNGLTPRGGPACGAGRSWPGRTSAVSAS
ncbi:SRPBCC domain-containing protein [Streptomyces sp. NPDC004227]